MSIIKYRSIDPFFSNAETMLEQFFGKSFNPPQLAAATYPKLDIVSYADKYVVEAAVPGLSQDQVSVDLDKGFLTISGEKQEATGERVFRELKKSAFTRVIDLHLLDEEVKYDKIAAKFENGMVIIDIPKKEIHKPKKLL